VAILAGFAALAGVFLAATTGGLLVDGFDPGGLDDPGTGPLPVRPSESTSSRLGRVGPTSMRKPLSKPERGDHGAVLEVGNLPPDREPRPSFSVALSDRSSTPLITASLGLEFRGSCCSMPRTRDVVGTRGGGVLARVFRVSAHCLSYSAILASTRLILDCPDVSATMVRRQPSEATAMFRIIRGQDYYTMAASPDDIVQALLGARPGRFIIEEVSPAGKLLPSGHTCRRWGTAIRYADGQVTLDPDPWPG
jgi:hypothetical protein